MSHSIPKTLALVLGVAVLAFLIGRRTVAPHEPPEAGHGHTEMAAEKAEVWTCSMHPSVRQNQKGKCPLCGMDLIPLAAGGEELGERTLRLSPAARALAEVRTAPVERRFAEVPVLLSGRIEADEARVRQVSAWASGRIERLFVDSTGIPVQAGEHLVELYSPELYAAQEEYLQALAAVERLTGANEFALRAARDTAQAAADKLRLLGLEGERVAAIRRAGKPNPVLEIRSPAGGVVIEKQAREGMYVRTGNPLYTVADLSRVWVVLDAYESDLPYLRLGQRVETRTAAFGDEVFAGRISFISPTLEAGSRTTRVRVVLENPGGRLRPGMLVRATILARIGEGGTVVGGEFRGAWSCPMHPEVVREETGDCPVCGMPLVAAGELGYADPDEASPPLLVPASAVLATGRRAVVYVREEADDSLFTGVEVSLGPRAGDFYVVLSGLREGQQVVARGGFKIDSELQLQAKPSMMSLEPPAAGPLVPQQTCPIMGGEIDRAHFADVRGQRIYVCCPGCIETIRNDPEAALATLHGRGEYAETRQKICPVMGGEIDPELFVEHLGRRLYVCCEGCLDEVRRDPAKHADKVAREAEGTP